MSYNNNFYKKNQVPINYVIFFIFAFFTIALSWNAIKLSRNYLEQQQMERTQQKEKIALEEVQNQFKLKIRQAETEEFIEQKARELTLSKENEYVVIGSYPTPTPTPTPIPTPYNPPYHQWMQVFNLPAL